MRASAAADSPAPDHWATSGATGATLSPAGRPEKACYNGGVVTAILLASNSPRRRELLALTGWQFRVQPSDIDERLLPGERPDAYVQRLAAGKAQSALSSVLPSEIILAADTTVALGQLILGKPENADQAREMLRLLRGKEHTVFTGIALVRLAPEQTVTDLCVSTVPMRPYSDQELDTYVNSGDPLDKAGAYNIHDPAFDPAPTFAGCMASVMGLPLCHLARAMKQLGEAPGTDIPQACQAALGYHCSVFPSILGNQDAR